MKKNDFNYHLPEHLIAQKPLAERSASRMLCMNRHSGELQDRMFIDFADLISADDLLVFNNTKVIPARLFGRKQSGGKVEILIERVLDDRRAVAHMRASKSPKAGAVIELDNGFSCTVTGREGDLFCLQTNGRQTLPDMLAQIGHMPLPPYINRADDEEDLSRYQTVFAEESGAVAAPTAGLHFDQAMMDRLDRIGVGKTFVTLHVGSGTFQPVRVENLAEHVMHKEFYSVSIETVSAIEQTRERGGRVIAIGTTAVRALESASRSGQIKAGFGETDLFITPGYQFKSVDAMLTNFHLPESTLLMLIAAFAGYDPVMKAYRHAIEQQYRFFSYGDAMFLSS
ncbi:tRNA preQ1(34) S-adenosylmethionine ribosyltransferase-isomerase QueA [Methylomarinum sp. Ch1-1]|uniref:S-adenosylmethionine:tRNA ribosyltransferase-isomerase n=1 Tax=Methylomarinum roseum TaxID=3067653 RepID=A0AAU7NU46_9GAMM